MITFAELSLKIINNEIQTEDLVHYLCKDYLGIAGVVIMRLINEKYCNEEILEKLVSFRHLLNGNKFVGPWKYGHVAIAALYLFQDKRASEKYKEIYNDLSSNDRFLVDNFIATEAYKY